MKTPKRVTFVINNLDGGGAERVLVNLLNNLDRRKFIPRVFLFENYGSYLNQLNSDIEIGYASDGEFIKNDSRFSKKINKYAKYIIRSTKGVKKLEDFIKDDDIVVAFLEKMITYNVARIIRKSNKKSYAWLHTNISGFSKVQKFLSHKFYKYYDGIICVSKECADIAKLELKEYRDKIYVEYNPIEIDLILKKSIEKSNYSLGNRKNIIAIGRLTKDKGFDILINAFSKIDNDNINLTILGEGEDRNQLENIIKDLDLEDRVFLPGFVDNPFPILKECDLFVLSSRREGLPTVLIEALALEKKIVSTRCSGANEILVNGKYGYLCNVEDVTDLSIKIKNALNSESKCCLRERALDFEKNKVIKDIEIRLSK